MSKRRLASAVEPRKEPKQDRSRQTYQVILRGATKIIRRFGVQKFSTNKVAEESGVSIGSLYQYFPSKEAIVAALIDQIFEQEYLRLKACLKDISPKIGARELCKHIFSLYYNIGTEDLNYRKVMIDAIGLVGKTPEAVKFHRSMAELILNFMHEHYNCNCANGEANHRTTVFTVQYMLRATAQSSVDEDIVIINRDILIEELSEALMNFLKVPAEYRGVLS